MKPMHIICVGGGSGGHITPIFPVLHELSKYRDLQIELVVDQGFYPQAKGLVEKSNLDITLKTIASGRLRRYANYRWYDYLKEPSIPLNNLLDTFKIAAGYLQSLWLLRSRPDVVFAKGGFVSLPLGLAANHRGIPLVIHDSDARPGLTNRVLSRFAQRIGTGTPVENYPYNQSITRYTGVPILADYRRHTEEEVRELKRVLGFDPDRPLIVATGGGLGAQSINQAMLRGARDLLEHGLQVFHITGKNNYTESLKDKPANDDYRLVDFVYGGMSAILGAADIVVSRASATTIQELAGLGKPTILIPAAHLGDQIQNAQIYRQSESAIVLRDDDIKETQLTDTILQLWDDPEKRQYLSDHLHAYARPKAAADIAKLILEVMK